MVMMRSPSTSSTRAACVEAGQAATAARQSATTASNAAPKYGDDDQACDYNSNNDRVFTVRLFHTPVPAGEGPRDALKTADRVGGHGEDCLLWLILCFKAFAEALKRGFLGNRVDQVVYIIGARES